MFDSSFSLFLLLIRIKLYLPGQSLADQLSQNWFAGLLNLRFWWWTHAFFLDFPSPITFCLWNVSETVQRLLIYQFLEALLSARPECINAAERRETGKTGRLQWFCRQIGTTFLANLNSLLLYLGCSDLLQINDHKRAMVDLLHFTILHPLLLSQISWPGSKPVGPYPHSPIPRMDRFRPVASGISTRHPRWPTRAAAFGRLAEGLWSPAARRHGAELGDFHPMGLWRCEEWWI